MFYNDNDDGDTDSDNSVLFDGVVPVCMYAYILCMHAYILVYDYSNMISQLFNLNFF